jgi:hypothetical protein
MLHHMTDFALSMYSFPKKTNIIPNMTKNIKFSIIFFIFYHENVVKLDNYTILFLCHLPKQRSVNLKR